MMILILGLLRFRRCFANSGLAGQSHATVFAAWQVANVPFGDTLNVRKYPSGTQKQAAYPNGTVLQMTGRCTGG